MARTNKRRSNRNGRGELYAHIVGWGVDIPKKVLTNDDLSEMMDTNDEWIQTRTGIRERRIADDRDTIVTLGLRAARKALQVADMLPEEVELVIVATSSPTYFFPAAACRIQDRLGARQAGAFDILAACTGFIYGLGLASAQIRSGAIKTALVIGTETLSRILDWTDRGTAILFGDGAGAFVLKASETPGGVLDYVMHSDGSGGDLLFAPSGARPSWNGTPGPDVITEMNGREVFRFASRVMASATQEVLDRAGLTMDDIDMVVPHQANKRIIHAAARGMKLPEDKYIVNVERYGNTSTASIPIALVEGVEKGLIKRNDRLVLVGFGGGLTWGAAIVDWHVEPTTPPRTRNLLRQGFYMLATLRSLLRRLIRSLEGLLFGSPIPEATLRDAEKQTPEKEDAE
jgi:3-oxoacyl-[acyl-carrier-protein] synthase-3